MITSRKALLQKLKTIAPAVAKNDVVPVQTHFSFTGHDIVAYNEKIALSVPKVSDFRGTIPANILIDLLEASQAPAVEVRPDDGIASVTLGDASFKLGSLPADDFNLPPISRQTMRVTAQFFDGIAHCLQSVSGYSPVPDQLGVTLIADGHHVRLFATNRATMSYTRVAFPQPCKILQQRKKQQRVILSADFCRQMLKLAAQAQTTQLVLHKDHAWFLADEVLLFGRLIQTDNPIKFDEMLKRLVPENLQMVAIPPTLSNVLKRAARIGDIKGSEVKTEVTITDSEATFCSRSVRGEAIDRITLPGQPDIECAVNARLLHQTCTAFDKILFTERCVITAKGDLLHVVACFGR